MGTAMTIPADRIKFSDDGTTAWLIVRTFDQWFWEEPLDRPCDTCGGGDVAAQLAALPDMAKESAEAIQLVMSAAKRQLCTCIDGRHTFPIEVGVHVSVVPGMVLPIVGPVKGPRPLRYVLLNPADADAPWMALGVPGPIFQRCDPLPSAAAPGMFAVRLNVHTLIGAGS